MANVKIFTDMIEDMAKDQVDNIASMDAFKDAKIRIMPDVHAGKGCVCGFTADLGDKAVPNLIGVDIGCGMLTVCLGSIDIDFKKLDEAIRANIPSGMNVHDKAVCEYDIFKDADPRKCFASNVKAKANYIDRSVGSLGSGNHFIEIDVDKDNNKYLVIHTGSRNFGKLVCEYWQKVAASKMSATEFSEEDIALALA